MMSGKLITGILNNSVGGQARRDKRKSYREQLCESLSDYIFFIQMIVAHVIEIPSLTLWNTTRSL